MVHELIIPVTMLEEQGKIKTRIQDLTKDFIREFGDENGIPGLAKVESIRIWDLKDENSESFIIYRAYDENGDFVEFDHVGDFKEFLDD